MGKATSLFSFKTIEHTNYLQLPSSKTISSLFLPTCICFISQDGLVISHHADHTLNSFCHWQSTLGGREGRHHDHAILLTGLDICSWKNEPCDTLGTSSTLRCRFSKKMPERTKGNNDVNVKIMTNEKVREVLILKFQDCCHVSFLLIVQMCTSFLLSVYLWEGVIVLCHTV